MFDIKLNDYEMLAKVPFCTKFYNLIKHTNKFCFRFTVQYGFMKFQFISHTPNKYPFVEE